MPWYYIVIAIGCSLLYGWFYAVTLKYSSTGSDSPRSEVHSWAGLLWPVYWAFIIIGYSLYGFYLIFKKLRMKYLFIWYVESANWVGYKLHVLLKLDDKDVVDDTTTETKE